jgi:hypothetical protein
MYHFVVVPLCGISHAGLLPNAKPSDAYSERIIPAGLFLPLSGVQQLGHLTTKDELRSEEIEIVHAEEEENSIFHLFWYAFCCPRSVVCEKI